MGCAKKTAENVFNDLEMKLFGNKETN